MVASIDNVAAIAAGIEHASTTAAQPAQAFGQLWTAATARGAGDSDACGAGWCGVPVVVLVSTYAGSVSPRDCAVAVARAVQAIMTAPAPSTPFTDVGQDAARHDSTLRFDAGGRFAVAPHSPVRGGPAVSSVTPTPSQGDRELIHRTRRGRQLLDVDADVEFEILGPLRAVHAGEVVGLGSAQQRAVLALLLLRAPAPVTLDRLADELWGERPPATAHHAVQVYVSGIRKALRAVSGTSVVRTSASGYVLDVDLERVDARRFERLIEKARRVLCEDPAEARGLYELGLSWWRSVPLAEFEQYEWARREADRLGELREVALEGLAKARLALGEHGEVIGTLTALVTASPLRERPRWLLMLALYRSGRHAEALAAYRDACTAFDEIGLQPGPELRALEAAILRHDPTLAADPPLVQR